MGGRRADRPARELRRKLTTGPAERGRRCGVEHEYVVRRGGTVVDFGTLVRVLALPGARLDPIDRNAHRQVWGGVLTADGREAEIVTPPVRLTPGSSTRVAALAGYGHRQLRHTLASVDDSFALEGYSTHVNVEVGDRDAVRVARRLVARVSADLMLLIDRPTSPGLLIRPRRGRLEVGGDFLVNRQLRGAITFTASAVAAASVRSGRGLPAPLDVSPTAADTRYGWYVDRRAFGADLYTAGRGALLHTREGTIRAGDHLGATWSVLRQHAEAFSTADELAAVDRLVDGRTPLPLEEADDEPVPDSGVPSHAAGDVIAARRRGVLEVTAQVATWHATLFRVCGATGRSCVVSVPDRDVAAFLNRLDHGDLDPLLLDALAHPSGRVLMSAEQTTTAGIWDDVADASVIAPPERDLDTGRIGGGGGHRPEKGQSSHSLPGRPAWSRPRWLVPAVVGGTAVIALAAAGAVAASSGGSGNSKPSPTAVAAAAARAPVRDDQLSGTYNARIDNLDTTQTGGNLSGVTATLDGSTVTYPAPDGNAKSLTFPGGTVTLECVAGTCTAIGPSGLSTVVLTGSSAHGTSPGVNAVISECGAAPPAGAAGSGVDVPLHLQRTTARRKTEVTEIRYLGVFGFAQRPTGSTSGSCVGYIVGTFDVILTRA